MIDQPFTESQVRATSTHTLHSDTVSQAFDDHVNLRVRVVGSLGFDAEHERRHLLGSRHPA